MRHTSALAAAVGLLIAARASAFASQTARLGPSSWVATGTITEITGATAYILMKDNQTYRVDSSSARVIVRGVETRYPSLRINDLAKVTGRKTGPLSVRAGRILIYPVARGEVPPGLPQAPAPAPPPEPKATGARIISVHGEEKTPQGPAQPEDYAAQPPSQTPKPPAPTVTDVRRGLVADMWYDKQTMWLQTSEGLIAVDLAPAEVVYAGRTVSTGFLNPGDAVEVSGKQTGKGSVTAARVDILRRLEQPRATPNVQRRTFAGTIVSIDYPSYTFTMSGAPARTYVMVDKSSAIRDSNRAYRFTDLRPGTRVKITGYGSQASGYVAQEVHTIGGLPR